MSFHMNMRYLHRKHRHKLFLPSVFLGSLLVVFMHSATHAEVTLDGSLGPSGPLEGPDYAITHDLGQTKGANLFHSFDKFNVLINESATFSGPDSIENIISRITGGDPSVIDGLLRCTIDEANLFLLNPSGVLFGENASLDLKGSFHVSTADYLSFADGEKFYADLGSQSVLTVAAPAAFGFLNENPMAISIQGGSLSVPEGQTLSVVAGDIEITGPANGINLLAPSGRINIASVGSSGEVVPNGPGEAPDLEVGSFDNLGEIHLTQYAHVDAGGSGGGTIVVRAADFSLDGSSVIYASTKGPAGDDGPGAGIDIQVTEDLAVDDGSQIGTNVLPGAEEDSRGVLVTADHVEVSNGAEIQSVAFTGTSGQSGDVKVTSNSLVVRDGGAIRTGTGGTSSDNAGDILVKTGTLDVQDRGLILSLAFGGEGDGGAIDVMAETVTLSNLKDPGPQDATGITTSTYRGTGKGGDIRVKTDTLNILKGSAISAATYGFGLGGNVDVSAEGEISISGSDSPNVYTGIFANTFGDGDGGSLQLTSDSLEMTNHASLQASTFGSGSAGDLSLSTSNLEIMDASFISTAAFFGLGLGNAGDIDITADSVLISGPESSSDPFQTDATAILAGSREGTGGDITITTDSLTLTNRGSVFSSSFGSGSGGDIKVDAGTLEVLNGANINANAYGSGDGGDLSVTGDTVIVSGVHTEPFTSSITGLPTQARSGINSQTITGGGHAGDVNIQAGSLEVLDGGSIITNTYGTGNGGNIVIGADQILVSGVHAEHRDFLAEQGADPKLAGANLTSNTNDFFLGDDATGDAGDISVVARNLQVKDEALIYSAAETPGVGGDIELTADQITLSAGALVSAESMVSPNAGKAGDIVVTAHNRFQSDQSYVTTAAEVAKGGDISISARKVELTNNALVSAESSGEGDAGNVTVTATETHLIKGSAITTEAKEADGGNIRMNTEDMAYLSDSEVSASVGGGRDTVGGNIAMGPETEYVILNGSKIIANAYEGKGGNINITAGTFLADASSIVDASSKLGIDGTVDIRAPIRVISGFIAPLPEEFLSAAELLREPCEARLKGGEYSSFVIGGRDGLPVQPGGLLPSPLYLEGRADFPE